MLGQSRKDHAAHHAARHAAFENTFGGQLKKIKDCQAGNNHTFAADPHYGNKEFCTTCETERN
jgi:hypothetical protein